MKFKGFSDWVEIFRGGRQADSQGREHDGDALIEKAVAVFDREKHEPPLVVGHPKTDSPAFGWVEDLKVAVKGGTKVLLARFKQVVPEFGEAVRQGLYKKRSASFYPDGRLRHVGFLGAAAPAVEGLANLKFEDEGAPDVFEFSVDSWTWSSLSHVLRRLREWLIEKEGRDTAEGIIPETVIGDLERAAEPDPEAGFAKDINQKKREVPEMGKEKEKEFTQADLEKSSQEAAEKAAAEARAEEREKVEAEFAQREAEASAKAREKEASEWCERMVKEGKLTPALVKAGLPEVLHFLAAGDQVIEFGEAKEKRRPDELLKDIFEKEMPKLIDFGEIATRESDVGGGGAAEKLEALTRARMKEQPPLDYGSAFAEVQKEHPALVQEYQAEMTAG